MKNVTKKENSNSVQEPSRKFPKPIKTGWEYLEVPKTGNVAGPLTKPLSRAKHDQHQDSLGVRIITM